MSMGFSKLGTGHPRCRRWGAERQRVRGEDVFWSVQTMVSHSACVLTESRKCFPDLGCTGGMQ
jgi:hypothetical protein